MAGSIPSVPSKFLVQAGNQQVYLSWFPAAGATSYEVLRSTDSLTFSTIATISATSYYDTTAVLGALYYYSVKSVNANGSSNQAAPQAVTAVDYGQMSLGQIRLASQQRADMVNSNFVTTQEWNSYINQSYTELYDLMVQVYGDEYFVATPYQFVTDGRYPALYPLPPQLYKLMGVDLSIAASTLSWVTLKKFSFISRNRYIFGNTPVSYLGVLNLRYRMLGSNIELIPQPSSGQTVQLWYVPRPSVLLADSDILDSVSGWSEYVITSAALKAMQKEESDVSVLGAQLLDLRHRIEAAASNRDVGEPECASDIRRIDGSYYGDGFGDFPNGGY